jgi:hypothetical protein
MAKLEYSHFYGENNHVLISQCGFNDDVVRDHFGEQRERTDFTKENSERVGSRLVRWRESFLIEQSTERDVIEAIVNARRSSTGNEFDTQSRYK